MSPRAAGGVASAARGPASWIDSGASDRARPKGADQAGRRGAETPPSGAPSPSRPPRWTPPGAQPRSRGRHVSGDVRTPDGGVMSDLPTVRRVRRWRRARRAPSYPITDTHDHTPPQSPPPSRGDPHARPPWPAHAYLSLAPPGTPTRTRRIAPCAALADDYRTLSHSPLSAGTRRLTRCAAAAPAPPHAASAVLRAMANGRAFCRRYSLAAPPTPTRTCPSSRGGYVISTEGGRGGCLDERMTGQPGTPRHTLASPCRASRLQHPCRR